MLTLFDLILSPRETLETALARMTGNRRGILFVCDDRLHLEGVLTDGDVRRTLLEHTLLMAPVSKAMNLNFIAASSAEEARSLLDQFTLAAVPVVRADGRIVAILAANPGGPQLLEAPLEAEEDTTGPRAVALIPARGGSKRMPKKNLAKAGGKTLLAWAIEAARGARQVSRVLVSTDDPEIAATAEASGAEVPWLRPAELAQDATPSLDVVEHAIDWCLRTWDPAPEVGLLIEPTAPLRRPEHVDAAIDALLASDADSAITVSEVPHVLNPEELVLVDGGQLRPYVEGRTLATRRLRGQQQPPVYAINGLVYAFYTRRLLEQKSLYGRKTAPVITQWEDFLDVDTADDLQIADLKLRRQRV